MTALDVRPTTGAELRALRRRRLVRRFFRRKLAVIGLVAASLTMAVAVFAPLLAPYDPSAVDFANVFDAPSASHWLGTDELGRDVLSRIIFGSRAAMQVGVGAVALGFLCAVPIGLVSGYVRGWVDAVIMRIVDALLAFPFVILTIGFAAIFGPSLFLATVAIGISLVPGLIRIVRGETLALREEEYVAAAVANGAGTGTIMFRHLLPNMRNTLIVQATVLIPLSIIIESVVSFLGLGVQPPTPSWGVMLSRAQTELGTAAHLSVAPGVAILIATLAFNLLGDGLRDVLDPKDRD